MELSLPSSLSAHALAIKLTLAVAKPSTSVIKLREGQSSLSLRTGFSGAPDVTGINTICKAICRRAAPGLLGGDPAEAAMVEQWMTFVHTKFTPIMDAELASLNDWLAPRTFVVGHKLSLADLVLYCALSPAIVKFPVAQQSVFCHILRWYNFVHHTVDAATASGSPCCGAVSMPPQRAPSLASLPAASTSAATSKGAPSAASSATAAPAAAAATGGKAGKEKTKGPDAAAAAAVAAASKGKGPEAAGGASPAKTEGAAGGAEVAAKGGGAKGKDTIKDAAKKAERAAKNAAKQAPKADAAEPRIDMLDIRIGTITKVQKHPEADALYLEEIDVGEEKPRQVISGLVKFVPEAEMWKRRVAVVCNLKPAKMRGVMSYGMVLCASGEEAVEPVIVPEGVPNGERVMVEGYGNDAEEQINPKKKILEALFPDMATDVSGVACFKGVQMGTSAGPLTSKLKAVPVK